MLEALAQIVANKISETYRREAEIPEPEKVYQVDRDTVLAVLTHLRDNVTPEMVEAGIAGVIHQPGGSYKWPDDFDTEERAIARRNTPISFTAMLNKAMEE